MQTLESIALNQKTEQTFEKTLKIFGMSVLPFDPDPDNNTMDMLTDKAKFTNWIPLPLELAPLAKFCGTDDLRPVMMNVYVNDGEAVATNAHILKYQDTKIKGTYFILGKVFPLAKQFDSIKVAYSEDYAAYHFTLNGMHLKISQDTGRFPDWKQVIPKPNKDNYFTIDGKKLAEICKQAKGIADKLTILDNKAHLINIDMGYDVIVNVGEFHLSFNYGLNLNFLNTVCNKQIVSFTTNGNEKAAFSGSNKVLVMPIMLDPEVEYEEPETEPVPEPIPTPEPQNEPVKDPEPINKQPVQGPEYAAPETMYEDIDIERPVPSTDIPATRALTVQETATTSEPLPPEVKNEPQSTQGTVSVIDYSEKAFALTGNTEPLKNVLKLKGRYNPYLSCGKGWIFSKKRMSEVLSNPEVIKYL